MLSKKTEITVSITCVDEKFAEVVLKSLEPENKQIDEKSSIIMKTEGKNLIIEFSSYSSISTIRNTLDDILNTINTTERIYKTVTKTKS